jgi:hypothetical protein
MSYSHSLGGNEAFLTVPSAKKRILSMTTECRVAWPKTRIRSCQYSVAGLTAWMNYHVVLLDHATFLNKTKTWKRTSFFERSRSP